MLFRELPLSVKKATNLQVNAEKDTAVITRLVQSWREPTNPISNTIGNTSSNVDFLISAPYADKLPNKVAELIRKDTPFAILIPLPLLNEIDRTGKDSIDEEVRAKRLNMKLVVSTSLGQGWLINHPECKLDKTSHAIFFATCTNQVLQDKSEDIFLDWTKDALQHSQSKFTPSEQNTRDIDSAILRSIDEMFSQDAKHALTPRELRAKKRTMLQHAAQKVGS
jgi:hypothetical protein